jgi:hypothetical protein
VVVEEKVEVTLVVGVLLLVRLLTSLLKPTTLVFFGLEGVPAVLLSTALTGFVSVLVRAGDQKSGSGILLLKHCGLDGVEPLFLTASACSLR